MNFSDEWKVKLGWAVGSTRGCALHGNSPSTQWRRQKTKRWRFLFLPWIVDSKVDDSVKINADSYCKFLEEIFLNATDHNQEA